MASSPEWLVEGARVVHSMFGTGVVKSLGEYQRVPALWIDFDFGMRMMLAPRMRCLAFGPRVHKIK